MIHWYCLSNFSWASNFNIMCFILNLHFGGLTNVALLLQDSGWIFSDELVNGMEVSRNYTGILLDHELKIFWFYLKVQFYGPVTTCKPQFSSLLYHGAMTSTSLPHLRKLAMNSSCQSASISYLLSLSCITSCILWILQLSTSSILNNLQHLYTVLE